MTLKPYPKAKDTPSRRSRKAARNSIFLFNRNLRRLANRAKRAARAEDTSNAE